MTETAGPRAAARKARGAPGAAAPDVAPDSAAGEPVAPGASGVAPDSGAGEPSVPEQAAAAASAAPAPPGGAHHPRRGRHRFREARGARLRRLGELLALTAFAVAQPVLDVTGRSPDFFLFRQPSLAEMWLLVAVVAFAPPLALWLGELLVGTVSRTLERAAHLAAVAGLLAMVAVQVGKQNGLFGRRLAAAAVVAGMVAAVVVARSEKVRQVLRFASPAPLIFVLVFALMSPAGALLRPAKSGGGLAATGTKRPPIVFLVFDEFPTRSLLDAEGRIDETLFPNFAELAGASTWYPNATGMSGFTPYAVPPLLTGKVLRSRIAPAYVEHPDNLFTLLGDAYRINAYESISQLCPPQYCETVSAGRAVGLRPLAADTLDVAAEVLSPRKPKQREGEEFAEQPDSRAPAKGELDVTFRFGEGKRNQPERLTSFLDGLARPGDKPTLDFLHLLLPHIPFRYLPSGLRYQEHPPSFPLGRGKIGDTSRRNPIAGALEVQQQRMLLQLAYLDGLVGQLVDKLKKAGVWDEALVVVSADHGEGFTPDEKSRQLDANNVADLAYTPLFVKQPHQPAGRVDERNAMNVDVLPTIADILDVPVRWRTDGVSLLGPPRPNLDKQWYDTPGKPVHIDGARWAPVVRRGLAPGVARPELGREGLFAPKPLGALFGKPVRTLTVGAPAPAVAKSSHPVGWRAVSGASGLVPALLWGDLDRPVGAGPAWLAVSVNGTIAGGVFAAPDRQQGAWHFVGVVDDQHFRDGSNDVVLYTVSGTTLHPLAWAP